MNSSLTNNMSDMLRLDYETNSSVNTITTVREVDKHIMIALYAIIGGISFVLNSMIFLIVAYNKKLWTNSYCLLVSLAVTDWLIIVIGIPVHIANILAGESIMDAQWCKIYGYLINVPFQSSLYHLAIIAFHRYLLTVRRRAYERFFGKKKCIISICMAWFIPIVICSAPLFGWGKYFYDKSREHCMVDWMYSISFLIFIQIMALTLNVTMMAYCYFKIITKTRRRLKLHIGDKKKAMKRQTELRSTYMLLIVVMTCIFCFFPYCVLMFYEAFTKKRPSQIFGFLSMFFAYSNSMFDFVIYSAMNKRFRRCCRQLFLFCRKRGGRTNSITPDNHLPTLETSTNKNMRTVNRSTTNNTLTTMSKATSTALHDQLSLSGNNKVHPINDIGDDV